MPTMRELITLIESTYPSTAKTTSPVAPLPDYGMRLDGKKKTVVLKDGRKAVLRFEVGLTDYAKLTVVATIDGVYAGDLVLAPNSIPPAEPDYDLYAVERDSWSATHVDVAADYRRLGVATAMYDAAARAGIKIMRSGSGYGGKLLPDGSSLWASKAIWKNGRIMHQRFWKPKRKTAG